MKITVELRLRASAEAIPALTDYALRQLGDGNCACAGDGSYRIRRADYDCPCFRVNGEAVAETTGKESGT